MATQINAGTVTVNTQQAQANINKLAKSLEMVNPPLGRIDSNFREFEKSLDAATARVVAFTTTTGLIYGMSDALQRVTRDAIEVEAAMTKVQAILKVTDNELASLKTQLFAIANNTGQTFSEASKALEEFARQGLNAEKTLKATEAALIVARLSGANLEETINGLVATVSSFSNELLDYGKVANTLVGIDARFSTSAAGLIEGIKRVGTVASDAGITFEELGSAIAAVRQVTGRSESVIGNGLKTIFTNLQTDKVQKELSKLGIETKTATGQFLPLIQVVDQLAGAFQKLTDAQRADLGLKIAGKYQINTFKALIQSFGAGETSLFDQALQTARSSQDEAIKRNELLNQTTLSSLNRLDNAITQLGASFGDKVTKPLVKGFAEAAKTALDTISGVFKDSPIGDFLAGGIVSALKGPGLLLAVVAIGKLTKRITKELGDAIASVSGLNAREKENLTINQAIISALQNENDERVRAVRLATTLEEKQRAINNLISAYYPKVAKSTAGSYENLVTPALRKQIMQSPNTPKLAGGYLPNMASGFMKEQVSIAKGVGGARNTARAVPARINMSRGSTPVIVNTDEHIIRNFKNSGQDAVFNRDMTRSVGGVSNLRKFGRVEKVMASGYVPSAGKLPAYRSIRDYPFVPTIGETYGMNPKKIDFIRSIAENITGFRTNPILFRDELGGDVFGEFRPKYNAVALSKKIFANKSDPYNKTYHSPLVTAAHEYGHFIEEAGDPELIGIFKKLHKQDIKKSGSLLSSLNKKLGRDYTSAYKKQDYFSESFANTFGYSFLDAPYREYLLRDRSMTNLMQSLIMSNIPKNMANGFVPNFNRRSRYREYEDDDDIESILNNISNEYKYLTENGTPWASRTLRRGLNKDSFVRFTADRDNKIINIEDMESKNRGDAFKGFEKIANFSKRNGFIIKSKALTKQTGRQTDGLTGMDLVYTMFPQLRYRKGTVGNTSGEFEFRGRAIKFDSIDSLRSIIGTMSPDEIKSIPIFRNIQDNFAGGIIPNFARMSPQDFLELYKSTRGSKNNARITKEGRLYSPGARRIIQSLNEGEKLSPEKRILLDKFIEKDIPIEPIDVQSTLKNLPNSEQIRNALIESGKKRDVIENMIPISSMIAGEKAETRQDVPSQKLGIGVVTTTQKIGSNNKTSYGSFVRIKNPYMIPSSREQTIAMRIGQGATKQPTIKVQGTLHEDQRIPDLTGWAQVGFNPDRHSYYYDRVTKQPVIGGEEGVQIGNTIFVKKPKYGNPEDFAFANGYIPNFNTDSDYQSIISELHRLSPSQRLKFAKSNFRKLGKGSSRIAYDIGGRALKLPLNEAGIAQNRVETDPYMFSSFARPVLPTIFDEGPDDEFLTMQLAQKFNDKKFKNLVGVSLNQLRAELPRLHDPRAKILPFKQFPNEYRSGFHSIVEEGLISDDLHSKNLGIVTEPDYDSLFPGQFTKDRPVILDYGFTQDIADQYYKRRNLGKRFAGGFIPNFAISKNKKELKAERTQKILDFLEREYSQYGMDFYNIVGSSKSEPQKSIKAARESFRINSIDEDKFKEQSERRKKIARYSAFIRKAREFNIDKPTVNDLKFLGSYYDMHGSFDFTESIDMAFREIQHAVNNSGYGYTHRESNRMKSSYNKFLDKISSAEGYYSIQSRNEALKDLPMPPPVLGNNKKLKRLYKDQNEDSNTLLEDFAFKKIIRKINNRDAIAEQLDPMGNQILRGLFEKSNNNEFSKYTNKDYWGLDKIKFLSNVVDNPEILGKFIKASNTSNDNFRNYFRNSIGENNSRAKEFVNKKNQRNLDFVENLDAFIYEAQILGGDVKDDEEGFSNPLKEIRESLGNKTVELISKKIARRENRKIQGQKSIQDRLLEYKSQPFLQRNSKKNIVKLIYESIKNNRKGILGAQDPIGAQLALGNETIREKLGFNPESLYGFSEDINNAKYLFRGSSIESFAIQRQLGEFTSSGFSNSDRVLGTNVSSSLLKAVGYAMSTGSKDSRPGLVGIYDANKSKAYAASVQSPYDNEKENTLKFEKLAEENLIAYFDPVAGKVLPKNNSLISGYQIDPYKLDYTKRLLEDGDILNKRYENLDKFKSDDSINLYRKVALSRGGTTLKGLNAPARIFNPNVDKIPDNVDVFIRNLSEHTGSVQPGFISFGQESSSYFDLRSFRPISRNERKEMGRSDDLGLDPRYSRKSLVYKKEVKSTDLVDKATLDELRKKSPQEIQEFFSKDRIYDLDSILGRSRSYAEEREFTAFTPKPKFNIGKLIARSAANGFVPNFNSPLSRYKNLSEIRREYKQFKALEARYKGGDEQAGIEAKEMMGQISQESKYKVGPVYHGSGTPNISVFNKKVPSKTGYYLDFGTHFGQKETAEDYARIAQNFPTLRKGYGSGETGNEATIYETYLKAKWLDLTKTDNIFQRQAGKKGPIPIELKERLREIAGVSKQAKSYTLADLDPLLLFSAAGKKDNKAVRKAVEDHGFNGIKYGWRGDSYVVLNPSQIKSANPFTYNKKGKLIPPFRRFDSRNPDINYAGGFVPNFNLGNSPLSRYKNLSEIRKEYKEFKSLEARYRGGDQEAFDDADSMIADIAAKSGAWSTTSKVMDMFSGSTASVKTPVKFARGGLEALTTEYHPESFWTLATEEGMKVAAMYRDSAGQELGRSSVPKEYKKNKNKEIENVYQSLPDKLKAAVALGIATEKSGRSSSQLREYEGETFDSRLEWLKKLLREGAAGIGFYRGFDGKQDILVKDKILPFLNEKNWSGIISEMTKDLPFANEVTPALEDASLWGIEKLYDNKEEFLNYKNIMDKGYYFNELRSINKSYLMINNPLKTRGTGTTTPKLLSESWKAGYDSVWNDNAVGGALVNLKKIKNKTPEIVVNNPNAVKSAEPFTYDKKGKLIPLFRRFDSRNPNINYADGFIPNFAIPEQLGKGASGTFYKLRGNIGKKVFHRNPSNAEDIEQEYEIAKFLNQKAVLPSGVSAPKIIGNLDRSLQSKRIGKEVIEGEELGSVASYGFDTIPILSFIKKSIEQNNPLDVYDLHSGNVMVNKKGVDIASNYSNLINSMLSRYDKSGTATRPLRDRLVGRMLSSFARRGGELSIVDPGLFEFNSSKQMANGFIPNFAKPKQLGEGAYGRFYKLRGNIGKKEFKSENEQQYIKFDPKDSVKQEYEIAKFLNERAILPKGVSAPKVFGTLKRSLEKNRIGKEVIEGKTLEHLPYFPGFEDFIKNSIQSKNPIHVEDLHEGNLMVNSKGVELAKKYELLLAKLSILYPSGSSNGQRLIKRILSSLERRGGQLSIVDPGLFEFNSKKQIANGFIPNFNNPLKQSINREVEALVNLGYPKSMAAGSVKIGTNERLKNKANPMGLGVYNLAQGQFSLGQAIGQHSTQSQSEKFVPNFAATFTGGSGFGVPATTTTTTTTTSSGTAGAPQPPGSKNKKPSKGQKAKQQKLINDFRLAIRDQEYGVDPLIVQEILDQFKNKIPESIVKKELAGFRQREAQAIERFQKETGLFSFNRKVKRVASNLNIAETSNVVQKRQNELSEKRGRGLTAAAFGIPFAAGGIVNAIGGQDTKAGRITMAVSEAAGTLALGAQFGALGLVVSGVAAGLQLLNGVAKEFRPNLEELSKKSQELSVNNEKQLSSMQRYSEALGQLKSLSEGGASPVLIAQAKNDLSQAAASVGKRYSTEFLGAKTDEERVAIMQQATLSAQREQAAMDTRLLSASVIDKEYKGITGGFNQLVSNKSNIGISDLSTIAAELTKTVDISKISAETKDKLKSGEATLKDLGINTEQINTTFKEVDKFFKDGSQKASDSILKLVQSLVLMQKTTDDMAKTQVDAAAALGKARESLANLIQSSFARNQIQNSNLISQNQYGIGKANNILVNAEQSLSPESLIRGRELLAKAEADSQAAAEKQSLNTELSQKVISGVLSKVSNAPLTKQVEVGNLVRSNLSSPGGFDPTKLALEIEKVVDPDTAKSIQGELLQVNIEMAQKMNETNNNLSIANQKAEDLTQIAMKQLNDSKLLNMLGGYRSDIKGLLKSIKVPEGGFTKDARGLGEPMADGKTANLGDAKMGTIEGERKAGQMLEVLRARAELIKSSLPEQATESYQDTEPYVYTIGEGKDAEMKRGFRPVTKTREYNPRQRALEVLEKQAQVIRESQLSSQITLLGEQEVANPLETLYKGVKGEETKKLLKQQIDKTKEMLPLGQVPQFNQQMFDLVKTDIAKFGKPGDTSLTSALAQYQEGTELVTSLTGSKGAAAKLTAQEIVGDKALPPEFQAQIEAIKSNNTTLNNNSASLNSLEKVLQNLPQKIEQLQKLTQLQFESANLKTSIVDKQSDLNVETSAIQKNTEKEIFRRNIINLANESNDKLGFNNYGLTGRLTDKAGKKIDNSIDFESFIRTLEQSKTMPTNESELKGALKQFIDSKSKEDIEKQYGVSSLFGESPQKRIFDMTVESKAFKEMSSQMQKDPSIFNPANQNASQEKVDRLQREVELLNKRIEENKAKAEELTNNQVTSTTSINAPITLVFNDVGNVDVNQVKAVVYETMQQVNKEANQAPPIQRPVTMTA